MRGFSRNKTVSVAVVSLSMILLSFVLPYSSAKPGEFVLKWEEGWNTYDSTAAFSVFAEDIDKDGVVEIVTGGTTLFESPPGSPYFGQLRVWHKEWCTLTLEDSEEWNSYYRHDGNVELDDAVVTSVYVADADSDGEIEIVTVGYETLDDIVNGNVSIWNWDGFELSLDAWSSFRAMGYADTWFHSVVVQEITGDNYPEIIVAGSTRDSWGSYWGVLAIWNYVGTSLGEPEDEMYWQHSGLDTVARGVSVDDVDGVDPLDIVTAGYVIFDSQHRVDLSIWHFVGNVISEQASIVWYPNGNYVGANATSVEVRDIGGGLYSYSEIVVAGSAYSTQSEGMVSVWDWDGVAPQPQLMAHTEWQEVGGTGAHAASSQDVDEDGFTEIVTAGYTAVAADTYGQLAVWMWDGADNINEDLPSSSRTQWMHTGAELTTVAYDLHLEDIDPDSEIEIVTVGEHLIFENPNLAHREAELRIWTWNTPPHIDEWIRMCPVTDPGGYGYSMTYDNDHYLVFVVKELSFSRETWAYHYDTDMWVQKASITENPFGEGSLAYDAWHDRVIHYGDYGTAGGYPRTYEYIYDTNSWEKRNPSGDMPEGRNAGAMVYIGTVDDKIIYFGGQKSGGDTSYRTYAYDYEPNRWTDLDPSSPPPARMHHRVVYDTENEVVVLFGGITSAPGGYWYFDDAWIYCFAENSWEEVTIISSSRPEGRGAFAMSYDSLHKRTIIFGGRVESAVGIKVTDDTWTLELYETAGGEWEGIWEKKNPANSPSKRMKMDMVYDEQGQLSVLYGGGNPGPPFQSFHDTWVYFNG